LIGELELGIYAIIGIGLVVIGVCIDARRLKRHTAEGQNINFGPPKSGWLYYGCSSVYKIKNGRIRFESFVERLEKEKELTEAMTKDDLY